MASSSTMPEQNTDSRTVVIFAGNTQYLVGGGKLNAIQVRRVADGQQMGSLEAEGVTCLTVSQDGNWFGAGTTNGDVLAWDARTYKRIFERREPLAINFVGFSRDSTLFRSGNNRSLTAWDATSGQRVQIYDHEAEQVPTQSWLDGRTAVFAPTENSLRVYDKHDGRLFFEVLMQANSDFFRLDGNFVGISGDKIKKFDEDTGSTVAEWTVPYSEHSRIAISGHEEFIAYCANHTVTFWDPSTHTQSSFIERPQEISSIAFSPDSQLLAIAGLDGEVVIQYLRDNLLSDYTAAPCIHFADTVLEDTLEDSPLMGTTMTPRDWSNHAPAIISLVRVLVKRSKVYVADGSWKLALGDANKVIELDPLSPWGYERKYAALHQAEDYDNAASAFETMLSKMSQSSNPRIRDLLRHYIDPTDTRTIIRRAVQDAMHDSPPVLIDTASGRLLDKSEQAASFESHPVFKKLVSSMTTFIDHTRIHHDVKQYCRYAMLSHTWQDNELLFEKIIHAIVYDLEDSPINHKLKMFCKIVRDAGFHWAWSDTCCINRKDDSVLQEALVAMYRWYQGSSLTLVLLSDVHSPSQYGDLIKSIWNTRAWAFQEYQASRVVRFYNRDWTLYRNIDRPNHKESPEILLEMEEVTGVSAGALEELQPGLDNIRRKLSLVSSRETTLIEDEAYSLFGLFAISSHVAYGDGDQALGRLLAQMLSSSGDTSILAWTGQSGSFNSCLPSRIHVFSQLPTSHIPSPMTDAEMEAITAALKASLNPDLVLNFHDRLQELPVPSFVDGRMRLPCLGFKLGSLSVSRIGTEQMFCAQTAELGNIEITTVEDLSRFDSLILVHPWINFLLNQWPAEGTIHQEESNDNEAEPSSVPLIARRTAALQLIARLRQPFGALLLTQTGQEGTEYRRVASESLITVRVQDDTSDYLVDCIQVLDVL